MNANSFPALPEPEYVKGGWDDEPDVRLYSEAQMREYATKAVEQYKADAARLEWLQSAADKRKVEIARSVWRTGYEIGEWPSMRVTVTTGDLRRAIDCARSETER